MASRNELLVRAETFGINPVEYTNDSSFEQAILAAEAEATPNATKAGDNFSKLVKSGNGVKKWVSAPTKEELAEQVEATQNEVAEVPVDINQPQ